MQKKRHRVAILGCGSVASFHIEGWKSCSDEIEITALCDINPEQIAKLKQKWGAICGNAAEYTDYREMLAREKLDIVSILTQGDLHYELTAACLAAKTHIFMEKPVGYSLQEARRFKYLAHEYPDLKVGIAYSMRYHRPFMDLKALIEAGTLGRILTGEISYSHPHQMSDAPVAKKEADADDGAPDLSYLKQQSDIAGGDTTLAGRSQKRNPYTDHGNNYIESSTLTHSTHPWDMARFLFGEPREAFSTNALCMREDAAGIQMGILWMRSGALVHVLAGITNVPKVGGNQHQFVQVHGTLGSAWLMRDMYEPYERHAWYRTDGEIQEAPRTTDLPESSHGVVIRTRNFLDAIAGKTELICSMADGARTTDLLHALYLSEHTQTRVAVLPAAKTG